LISNEISERKDANVWINLSQTFLPFERSPSIILLPNTLTRSETEDVE
jgi:hypothetical protein